MTAIWTVFVFVVVQLWTFAWKNDIFYCIFNLAGKWLYNMSGIWFMFQETELLDS